MIVYLIVMCYVLPLVLFVIGVVFRKHSPQKINALTGYRTARSMKSQEAWQEANRYSAGLLFRGSWVLLAVTTAAVLWAGLSEDRLAAVMFVSMALSLVVIVFAVVRTEHRLKELFGE